MIGVMGAHPRRSHPRGTASSSSKLGVISADRAGPSPKKRGSGCVTVPTTCAMLYGIAGSFSSPLQATNLMRAGSAREISIPFIATLTGGHAIWPALRGRLGGSPVRPGDWITAVRLGRRRLPREPIPDPASGLLKPRVALTPG